MSRAAIHHGASAARAPHRLPWHRGRRVAGLPVLHSTRVDLAVSNEAIVKLFTSCLVKRDHSVVEMKVFEIFTCLHGLGMENKLKTNKKPHTNLQPKSLLDYVLGQWLAGGVRGDGTEPCTAEHPPMGRLPPAANNRLDDALMAPSHRSPLLSLFHSVLYLKKKKGKNKFSLL